MPLIHPAKDGGHLIAEDEQDKLLFVVFFRAKKKLLICDIIVCIRRQLVCGLFFFIKQPEHCFRNSPFLAFMFGFTMNVPHP